MSKRVIFCIRIA